MTAATIPGLDPSSAPTKHQGLLAWITEIAELTQPDRVVWSDGSDEEWERLTAALVKAGTLVKLNEEKKPNSFLASSDPADVARVESRTYICSESEEDAGPTNNWVEPAEMRATMTELYRGSMRGRTMFVIPPFCMGPLDSDDPPKLGVEITDSEYVVLSMKIMTRVGPRVLELLGDDGFFVKALHSVGAPPLEPGQADVPWPCNTEKYITLPGDPRDLVVRFGLRRQRAAREEVLRPAHRVGHRSRRGWMAEHMLILKLTSSANKVYYIAAAFPSACGKTNLAMLQPTIPGWKAETVGDDIAGCASARTAVSTRSTRSSVSSVSPRVPATTRIRTR